MISENETISRFVDMSGKVIKNGRVNYTGYLAMRDHNVHLVDGLISDDGDEPAVTSDELHFEHWQNGVLHNEDGPAVVNADGPEEIQERWINGRRES